MKNSEDIEKKLFTPFDPSIQFTPACQNFRGVVDEEKLVEFINSQSATDQSDMKNSEDREKMFTPSTPSIQRSAWEYQVTEDREES